STAYTFTSLSYFSSCPSLCAFCSSFICQRSVHLRHLHSFPTRRSSDLAYLKQLDGNYRVGNSEHFIIEACEYVESFLKFSPKARSEEHTSEFQSRFDLVCRLLLEKKNNAKLKNRRKDFNNAIEKWLHDG